MGFYFLVQNLVGSIVKVESSIKKTYIWPSINSLRLKKYTIKILLKYKSHDLLLTVGSVNSSTSAGCSI